MKNKTCGECKHYDMHGGCNKIPNTLWIHSTNIACIKFEAKNPTNGDRIRQMNNKEFAKFLVGLDDDSICQFCNYEKCSGECELGVEFWLNAPAGNDTNVPAKESEVEDEP